MANADTAAADENIPERPVGQPPEQQATRPGREHAMEQKPASEKPAHTGSGKLTGKIMLITGGDSGIGRAAAIAMAKEGADIAISYLEEHEDAKETERLVKEKGQRCLTIAGDIGDETFCQSLVQKTVDEYGRLDCLVNNAAEQHPQDSIADISAEQLERTFRTNIFAIRYVLPR
jgi:NAD(P)-dependent dehydrogenase (short-subunit alcohol dehydrogenase family)